jgi:hypothetical protein
LTSKARSQTVQAAASSRSIPRPDRKSCVRKCGITGVPCPSRGC